MTHSTSQPAIGLDTTGYALAVGGAVLFSTKAIFIKLAYEHGVTTETLLALRMLIALPVYLVILALVLVRRPAIRETLTARLVLPAMGVGLLGYYVASYLDFAGLNFVSAQYERLVLFTYPFFVLILGALFFKVPFTSAVVPGMAISYAGIGVLFGWNLVAEPDGLIEGTLLILGSAVVFALYQLLARQQMRVLPSMVFTCLGMSAASVLAISQSLAIEGPGAVFGIDSTTLAYGAAIAIFATVLPSFMMNAALSRIGARAAAGTGALGPVFTALIAVVVLGEAFTPFHAAGTVLVIVGTMIFSRAEIRAKPMVAAGVTDK
jgi:drug/metabolite transporter (DMT)-like permease